MGPTHALTLKVESPRFSFPELNCWNIKSLNKYLHIIRLNITLEHFPFKCHWKHTGHVTRCHGNGSHVGFGELSTWWALEHDILKSIGLCLIGMKSKVNCYINPRPTKGVVTTPLRFVSGCTKTQKKVIPGI